MTNHFPDDEPFTEDLNTFYHKTFVEMERVSNNLKVLKALTTFEYFKSAEDLHKA